MSVIDATAAVELVLMTDTGVRVADRIYSTDRPLHAPELLDLEVAQVLRKLVIRGEIEEEQASRAFADLGDLGVRRHGHRLLRTRIWQLRHNISAYDAAYVALAEALGTTLITHDQRLVRGAASFVELELI